MSVTPALATLFSSQKEHSSRKRPKRGEGVDHEDFSMNVAGKYQSTRQQAHVLLLFAIALHEIDVHQSTSFDHL